jgi:hypothetical protein
LFEVFIYFWIIFEKPCLTSCDSVGYANKKTNWYTSYIVRVIRDTQTHPVGKM